MTTIRSDNSLQSLRRLKGASEDDVKSGKKLSSFNLEHNITSISKLQLKKQIFSANKMKILAKLKQQECSAFGEISLVMNNK